MLTGILIILFVIDDLAGIINLLQSLANKVSINNTFLMLLIKITGIAFLSEFAVSICKDAGETAIASKGNRSKNYYNIYVNSNNIKSVRNNTKDITIKEYI